MSNDLIRTQTYTTPTNITNQQALDLENNLEADLIAKLSGENQGKLTDLEVKIASGGTLTEDDAATLLDMGKGLTAKDIDSLVTAGKIDRKQGDLLLAASTLGAFNETTTSAADVAGGLNKLFTEMNPEDREFTLNTFAQQGDVSRQMNVNVGANGQLTASYLLTQNGEPIGPADMPTTPDIQRAAMFLMSGSSDASAAGAVQAFTNWDFATAEDELSATLKSLPNYENLSPDTQANFTKYILSAGSVAAGFDNAANMDLTSVQGAQQGIETANNDLADLQAVMDAVTTAKSQGDVRPDQITYTDAQGEAHTVQEFLEAHPDITYRDADHDQRLGSDEAQAVLDSLGTKMTAVQSEKSVQQMILTGASQEEIDAAQQESDNLQLLASVMSAVRENTSAHDGGKMDLNTTMVFNPNTGENMSMKDALDELGAKYGDKEYSAAKFFKYMPKSIFKPGNLPNDGNDVLKDGEQDKLLGNLANMFAVGQHRMDATVAQSRTDWPGGSTLALQMGINTDKQYDMNECLEALEVAINNKGQHGQLNLSQVEFQTSDGTTTNVYDFMKDQGFDVSNKGLNKHVVNLNKGNDFINDLKNELSNISDQGDALKAQLYALTPPPNQQPTAPQARAGAPGEAPPPLARAGGSGETVDPNDLQSMDDLAEQAWGVDPDFDEASLSNLEPGTLTTHTFEGIKDVLSGAKDGKTVGPDELKELGFSDTEVVDIGLLIMFLMSDRMKVLGEKVQSVAKLQEKNTNDQADINTAVAALNTSGDECDLSQEITLKDGSTTTLGEFMDDHDIKYTDGDGDGKLDKEEIQIAISNANSANQGLQNEGDMIARQLQTLTSLYKQASEEATNMFSAWEGMKEKIIERIGN
ncbi:MAG: hypothetical protein AAF882_10210 [Pseudomonadota bacterium]